MIKSNARPEPEIDESKVNAEAVTQVNRTPEDVMGAFMEKNRHSISDSSAGKKTDDNQKDTPQAKDTTETAIKTKPAEDAEYYDKTPPVREEEDMFSPVTRFDSAGISQGVGGSSSGRSSSDTEERLRAFANADPDELV
ncbi:conjugal transfer protein TrbI, partial [Salmonella enterica subsp. enterica serovar Cerro]|nr:conjugal transfer protein TrbI [Salmonella enterica subsp. enterica serovar Cerro]